MAIDPDGIDLSTLDELTALKRQREAISQRIAVMNEKRGKVSEEVYQRVHADYQQQLQELAAKAAPLRQQAAAGWQALKIEMARIEADFNAARLDKEEIEFRHSLGEFDAAELKRRLRSVDERVEASTRLRDKAAQLKARYLAAVESEGELEAGDEDTARMPAIPDPPKPAAAAASTLRTQPPAPELPATTLRAPPSAPAADATLVAAPLPAATGSSPARAASSRSSRNPDATVVFRQGRLEPRNPEAGSVVQTLGLRPISIGSGSECDLQLQVAGLGKRHAEISMTRAGFCVRDTSSSGTISVNGETVSERVLADGDALAIGPALFHFRLL
jgi:hypothetical protein